MENKPLPTSTIEMGSPIQVTETPQVQPTVFTQQNFLAALERTKHKHRESTKPSQDPPSHG
jgi:hypothetical protein